MSSGDTEVVAVTRRGTPVLALLSWQAYEGLLETLEIMSDPELVAVLRGSAAEIREGRTYTADELRRELQLDPLGDPPTHD